MTRATANFNFWIINNASRLRARLSASPSFDEDAFQDAYLTLATECSQQEPICDIERAFLAAYRKHTGKHLSETYDTSHPDDLFFTLQFRDIELKIMGISNAEEVLDAVKDYVESGEMWV